jgi:hypothetical protein
MICLPGEADPGFSLLSLLGEGTFESPPCPGNHPAVRGYGRASCRQPTQAERE